MKGKLRNTVRIMVFNKKGWDGQFCPLGECGNIKRQSGCHNIQDRACYWPLLNAVKHLRMHKIAFLHKELSGPKH